MQKILNNKVFKVIYGIIKGIIIFVLAVYLLFVIVQRVTGNSDIAGYRVFTVATGSMEPVYKVNDVILVKTVDVKSLKVGDDIAYLADEEKKMLITHRIIKIEEVDGVVKYTLKGVNNEYEDLPITGDKIYGKVVGKVYFINLLNHVTKNIYGFFFLVFCPLVLVIFLEVADTIIDMRVEKNELKLKKSSNKEEEIDEEVI